MVRARRLARAGLALFAAAFLTPPAGAQTYPDRPVRIVVPTAPGGGYDLTARLLAQELSQRLGGSFIVDNVTGAGGLVGTRNALRPNDGYTLLIGGLSNLVLNMAVFAKPGYEPMRDFTPIGLLWGNPYVLVSRKDLAVRTVPDILAAAKADPGKLTIGSAGPGTGQDVMALLFGYFGGVDLNRINYRGAGPVYTDMIGGRIDLFFDSLATALPQIEGGAVRMIATTGAQRSAKLPDAPTIAQAGLPELTLERSSWFGLFAPAGTPQPVLEALRRATEAAAQSPDLQERFRALGGETFFLSAAETEALIKRETATWLPRLKAAGLDPE